jgi:hypothetical protein
MFHKALDLSKTSDSQAEDSTVTTEENEVG